MWKVERMVRSRAKFAVIGAAALVFAGVLGAPQSASASDEIVPEPRIAAVMAEVPGGVLLDENHAVWPELGMQMETPPEGVSPFAVGLCPTGYVCVFDGYGAQGGKISWKLLW